MKILLLGKDGQVGTALQGPLQSLGTVIAVGRDSLNLEHLEGLSHLLNRHRPDIIVNAAAYTAVDKAETDKAVAFTVNASVPRMLAEYAALNGSLLLHYSTDYVFDGKKSGPYVETDVVNPQNVYGVSKRAGEEAIQHSGCDFLIFRTSWVYSATGKNFIKTILQLAKEKENLRIVSDQYGAPTSAKMIADITAVAITAHQQKKIHNGLYHLTPTGSTTWHELGVYAVDKALTYGVPLKLMSQAIYPIATEEYPLPAKRPNNSMLDSSLLSRVLSLQPVDWRFHVENLIEQLVQTEFFL